MARSPRIGVVIWLNRLNVCGAARSVVIATAFCLGLAFGLVPLDALAATPCGGDGQRACCVASTERDNLGGACASGAIEQSGCGAGYGQTDCTCGGSGLAVFFGSSSSSHCVVPAPCGQAGQRACCITETRWDDNPIPASGGCEGAPGGGINNLTEVAGGVPEPAVCGGTNWFGVRSNGRCVPCGTEGAHACVGDSVAADARCQPGLVEDVFGYCTSCGGEGQLICRSTDTPEDWMCNRGFHPDLGKCVKDQTIAEPECDCDAVTQVQDPALPVNGYADLHLHMFANLGFGGLTVWGDAFDPNGGVSEALRADNYAQRTADRIINGHVIQGIHGEKVPIDAFRRQQLVHGDGHFNDIIGMGTNEGGGPFGFFDLPNGGVEWDSAYTDHFLGWPRWNSTTHQQSYFTWLLRAHRGGLQLVVLLAVTNETMCASGRRLDFPEFDCASSKGAIDMQLAKAGELETYLFTQCSQSQTDYKKLASVSWNPFYPPPPEVLAEHNAMLAKARVGIERYCAIPTPTTKPLTTIVIGSSLVQFVFEPGWFKVVKSPQEARQAIANGQLAVVLGIEEANLFGCSDGKCTIDYVQSQLGEYFDRGVRHIFPIHNFDNDYGGAATWMNTIAVGNRYATGSWYETEECPATPASIGAAAGYGFRLNPTVSDWLASVMLGDTNLFEFGTGPNDPAHFGSLNLPTYYKDLTTSCNKRGLTPLGKAMVASMMSKGMIVDVDHMSNKSLDDTLTIAEAKQYPGIVASHVLMFDLTQQPYRHERMRTTEQLQRIANVGGMIAAMTQPPESGDPQSGPDSPITIQQPPGSKIMNDCPASSKTWGQMYEWALQVMTVDGQPRPVAFGTDFDGISRHNAPRFGDEACDNQKGAAAQDPATKVVYPFVMPNFGTFRKQVTGNHTFDYNDSGLAHVGLLPDMIQDLKKDGLSDQDLQPLFQSAEAYIRMWEKSVEAAAHISAPATNDTMAPTVRLDLSHEANANGWHNDPNLVAVISATDEPGGSGVTNLFYRLTSEPALHVASGDFQRLSVGAEGTSTLLYGARDLAGNTSALAAKTVKQDLTAPTVPAGVTAVVAGPDRIDLTWSPATDSGGSGLDGYEVELCNKSNGCVSVFKIGTPTTNSFSHTGLTPATSYTYRVRSRDRADNTSGPSNAASVCTPPGNGPAPNYGGMWWNAPAGSESGWGLNIAHQCDIIFVTWFTYLNGKATWLVVAATRIPGTQTFSGVLYTGKGPAYNADPFDPAAVVASQVGTASFAFSDDNNATFSYTIFKTTYTKQITREDFGGPLPTCTWSAAQGLAEATNFQDMWWKAPAGSESGWGVNFAHQGDIIVATWFTYDLDGDATWFIVAARKTAANVYTGALFTGTGPSFLAQEFDPAQVVPTEVGTATLTFANGNSAAFSYTIDGVTRSKDVTRQIFAPPGTLCK